MAITNTCSEIKNTYLFFYSIEIKYNMQKFNIH